MGRKRKNSLFIRKKTTHSKDSPDNMTRKIKSWVISGLKRFINKKFQKEGIKERLYTLEKTHSYMATSKYNSILLNKKVHEILSYDISKKLKVKDLNINCNVINKIMKENKYKDIIDILNLTFLSCIYHFIGKEKIDALNGFENEFTAKKKESIKDYKDKFYNFVYNIDNYFNKTSFRIETNKNNNQ